MCSSEGNFGLRRSCTEVRRPTFWRFCVNPEIPPQMPKKGDYTHLLVVCRGLSSSEGATAGFGRSSAQNRVLGGDARLKSGEYLLLSLLQEYRKRRDLAWTAKALSKIYCHKRDTNLSRSRICILYHVLSRCTRSHNGVYLHRAGPRAMCHRRCLKGYDRASKWYSEKQRGTLLGSETIYLVSCHMTYKPPQADSPES